MATSKLLYTIMDTIHALFSRTEPVKWVFTGDSITHGALHTTGWRDYTEHFTERVRWEMGRRRDVIVKTAISGWTMDRITEDLDWNVLQFAPDCVSINVGMNDCNAGIEGLERFGATYLDTIERIRSGGAEVLLHTPNGILPTTSENRVRHLPAYVETIREIGHTTGAPVIDHYAEWTVGPPGGAMHSWLGDGCHPNEYGHRVMAHTLFRALGIWDENSLVCRLPVYRG
ncbi:MAG: SGNH/GDSL hydrolase family protein [candidate division Zixibacteria bacterium]|nr:SGNH/GDSL hydrolase family protein [candidate division Zixibacteria bacterium]